MAAVVIASGIVQSPALRSDFRHDDFLFFYQAANLPLADFLLTAHGGHLLMVRNAVFAICFRLFGVEPAGYMGVALATHLLNATLLFYIAERLLARAWIAGVVAALWGMAPIQQGTVNWASQYGGLLATTFVLLVLADLSRLAAARRSPSFGSAALWFVLLSLAATSFGSGMVVALVFGVAAYLLMPEESGRLRTALLLSAPVPFLALLFAVFSNVDPNLERSWSDVAPYTLKVFLELLAYGIASLFFGPWLTHVDAGVALGPLHEASRGAVIGAASVTATAIIATFLWSLRRAGPLARRQMLALASVALVSYAAIAVARVPLSISLFRADASSVAFTYRYHYLPNALIAVCIGSVLLEVSRVPVLRRSFSNLRVRPAGTVALALMVLSSLVPFYRASAKNVDEKISRWSREVFDSVRQRMEERLNHNAPGATIYLENEPFQALAWLSPLVGKDAFPGIAAVYVFTRRMEDQASEHVYFVERDGDLVGRLRDLPRQRISRLLVTPEEASRKRMPPLVETGDVPKSTD